jgi:hypothetical protein
MTSLVTGATAKTTGMTSGGQLCRRGAAGFGNRIEALIRRIVAAGRVTAALLLISGAAMAVAHFF